MTRRRKTARPSANQRQAEQNNGRNNNRNNAQNNGAPQADALGMPPDKGVNLTGPAKLEFVKTKIVLDKYRFNNSNYKEKRDALSKSIEILTKKAFTRCPEMPKRRDYANYISCLMTFTELYYFLGSVMDEEHGTEGSKYMPCYLIDSFEQYLETLEKCRERGVVELKNFVDLLLLRDKMVESLREHFLVGVPLLHKKEPTNWLDEVSDKYQPYDYEWLSATYITGDYQVPFSQFLATIRMNQLELSIKRAQIIRETMSSNTGFLRNIRIQIHNEVNKSHLIDDSLEYEEKNLRQDMVRYIKLISDNGRFDKSREVFYTLKLEQFNELCGLVRTKKRQLIDFSTHVKNEKMKAHLRTVGVLASEDAILLVLQKVFAFFVDDEKGFLGDYLPDSVLKPLIKLARLAEEKNCKGTKIHPDISRELSICRKTCHFHIKMYYAAQERYCMRHYTRRIRPTGQVYPEIGITPRHFPLSILHHSTRMIWHLEQQRSELIRLNLEIHKARAARTLWPKDAKAPYRMNDCDGIVAYFSNFDAHFPRRSYHDVVIASNTEMCSFSPESAAGNEIINAAHEVMHNFRAVPRLNDVKTAFLGRFAAELQGNKHRGYTSEEWAEKFTILTYHEIHCSGVHGKYKRVAETNLVAKEIANRMVTHYFDYVDRYRRKNDYIVTYLPSLSAPDVDSTDEQDEDDERSYSPEYDSPNGSEYATDEGPDGNEQDVLDVVAGALQAGDLDTVPDAIVDNFISRIQGVNLFPGIPEELANVPLD